MHIRDREFDPFAFRINDSALPETVDGYVFKQPAKWGFPLAELTQQQQDSFETGFGKQVIYGYENVLKTLKQGYAVSAISVDAISMWNLTSSL